jgi:predicted molibdopterin-dependent oxidoreductase YjgC
MEQWIGAGAATNPIWDLENSKTLLVVAGNPTEEQNVLSVPVKKAVREGAKMVVIDTRETELTRYAAEWLRPRPGSEPLLIAAIARAIFDEALEDKEFLSSRVNNPELLKNSLWAFDLAKTSRDTGVEESQIRRAARVFAGSDAGAILLGSDGLDEKGKERIVDAVFNLATITGNIGRESGGIFPLFEGANTVGARDMGATPDQNGYGISGMINAMTAGNIKAAVVFADGVSESTSVLNGLPAALDKLDFLVVSAVLDSEITKYADVVLPAETYAEQTATVTNLERRVQLLRVTAEPRHDERSGWRTICSIAQEMGSDDFSYESASGVFDEIVTKITKYGGLSHERLKNGGIQWPVEKTNNHGTPILFADDSKTIGIVPLKYSELAESLVSVPITFAPGRLISQPERDILVRKANEMNYVDRVRLLQIHPEDAKSFDLKEGDLVQVETNNGHVLEKGKAVFDSPHRGLVGSTRLFGELANRMQDAEYPDWSPLMPGLPYSEVRLMSVLPESAAPESAD